MRLKFILLALLFIFVVFGLISFRFYLNPVIPKEADIVVLPGISMHTLAWELKQQGIIHHPSYFVFLTHLYDVDRKMQAGEYHITAGTTLLELLRQIVEGKVIMHSVTFVDGWIFSDVKNALDNNPYIKHALEQKTPQQIMTALGHPNENPEGQFYPDTYLFGEGVSDELILKVAYCKMHQLLFNAWQLRAKGLPYQSPYQALIMASLIEKETSLAYEKPAIAGVLVRRLQRHMLLQVDPTVIYALGTNFDGNLSKQDLRFKSLYNTYLNKGLPPTPIALPDENSIEAALHPAAGEALYYVATGDGDHIFSSTLAEHERAVAEYVASLGKKRTNYYTWVMKQLTLPLCTLPHHIRKHDG